MILDAISLEIVWNRLVAAADEAAAAVVRTSFSTVVRESNDYACVLTDAKGNLLAENRASIPSFCDCLGRTAKLFLEQFPLDTWKPGDAILTNDPWYGTGHLPDYSLVTPIFHKGRPIGFACCVAHNPDVGGAMWAADCAEMFEEGTRIPPVRLIVDGKPNELVLDIIRANSRVPNESAGDLMAQVSANDVMAARVVELLKDLELDDLEEISAELVTRAEAMMREAVRAVPDGVYRSVAMMDGFDTPLRIECKVTVQGDDLYVDYSGTSPQVPFGINCVIHYTVAYTNYPLKCILDPHGPKNEGSYRPFHVTAPKGSLLHCRFPAAVSGRHLTGHMLSTALFEALAQAIPSQVIADSGSAPGLRTVFSGNHPGNNGRFHYVLFANGGMGARPTSDGLPCCQYPSNTTPGSIEVMEGLAPLVVWKKQIWQDSAGAGQWRGGHGQELVVGIATDAPIRFSVISDRAKFPPNGLMGGLPGSNAQLTLLNREHPIPRKGRTMLQAGDMLHVRFPGGGGYGDPKQRDRALIEKDLRHGVITAAQAKSLYGYEA
jgi:N-methylhydantoinase B